MKIPLVFFGTAQAVPTKKRNHTSILLSYKNENILIDCGEGTQRQFRKVELNPCKLTRLLITHWHGDHILGIPGLLQTLALNGYNRKLHVYGPVGTKNYIGKMLDMFIFEGKIDVEIQEIDSGKVSETEDFIVESEKMKHSARCLAYSFIEKDKIRLDKNKIEKLKLKGKIIGDLASGKDVVFNGKKIKSKDLSYEEKGKKISVIMDTSINPNMEKIAKDANLLICESTYVEDEKELAGEYGHLTARQAAETAKKAKVKKLILTHISQRYEYREKIILDEARKVFKNTEVAEDLMKIEV